MNNNENVTTDAAMADACSASLATIATAGRHAREQQQQRRYRRQAQLSMAAAAATATNQKDNRAPPPSRRRRRRNSESLEQVGNPPTSSRDTPGYLDSQSLVRLAAREPTQDDYYGSTTQFPYRRNSHSHSNNHTRTTTPASLNATNTAVHQTVVALQHAPPSLSSSSDTSSSPGGGGGIKNNPLWPAHREPCLATIRNTVRSQHRQGPHHDAQQHHHHTRRGGLARPRHTAAAATAEGAPSPTPPSSSDSGYAGSASSGMEDTQSREGGTHNTSSSSNSSSSSGSEDWDEDYETTATKAASGAARTAPSSSLSPLKSATTKTCKNCDGKNSNNNTGEALDPESSEIADYSSGNSAFRAEEDSAAASQTSSSSRLNHKAHHLKVATAWPPLPFQVADSTPVFQDNNSNMVVTTLQDKDDDNDTKPAAAAKKPLVLQLGCDVMAHVLTFLEPPEILRVLTTPLCKDWILTFTRQSELWRVLCLLEPFKAHVEDDDDGDTETDRNNNEDDDDSFCSNTTLNEARRNFGKFRLLYTSFVRCMRYLEQIKEDALHGRTTLNNNATADAALPQRQQPTGSNRQDSTTTILSRPIGTNQNLQEFLSRARRIVAPAVVAAPPVAAAAAAAPPPQDEALTDDEDGRQSSAAAKGDISDEEQPPQKRVKYGHSQLTQRLLGRGMSGAGGGEFNLPWSCGLYSIVNWMMSFSDVEGIQTMCLRVLPFLLEDEQKRITAQRVGLTDIVLRGMVLFPDSVMLHTAAFHTIVLLARPLGGQEGMLFHTSMVNSSGIFSSTTKGAVGFKSGIAVLLDSMRRFQADEVLQSMSCWSLVNIALAPAQKEVLVKLGGVEVTTKAMMQHPFSAEVQFRALFALINLVIPSVTPTVNPDALTTTTATDDDVSEKEMLDEMVDQIIELVVLSMKNFCSNEAVLNRACLVLHNISLSPSYHATMLLSKNCYQMLEWCLGNYRTDQVLQQSAAGTLHRLQLTLSGDERLRTKFTHSIQLAQQQQQQQQQRTVMGVPTAP